MTQQLNKVCIYGAGAIGGWLGLRLALAGCDVSVVARGATLAAVKANGLSLTQAASSKTQNVRVRASDTPADLGVQDVVVVAVKAPSMGEVAKSIAPLIGADTIVLTAMNGVPWWFFEGFGGKFEGHALQAVDPGGSIAKQVPGKHIIGCVVHASCSLDAPGHVRQHFGNKVIIGEPSGQKTQRARALQALLERSGLESVLSDQIQRDAWFKLWGNMTMNPISAMTGATTDRVLDDELVRAFIGKVMLEAKEIGARIGIPIDQQPEDRHQVTRKLGAFKTSMLQDVEAGRAVELDALVTVVKELGALTDVPTPWTDALLGLARLHARVRGLY
ncbi:2-dehydropantoate 2-reductase [Caenimonas koreensis DSM 17982]|uniref:2-dehydropantoate 2-reductase n=1 Tax=Caenimonas koreensis DSM 17982 TaxID=1121255 RepID=A0A844B883_9BURK|nr:2-dehydropantoate 2-reductase [Caenimonas koreensis]MRD46741.1 2-dehydropantoate 2-reductase [Caenimonas koreensis DSM 17982]